MTGPLILYDNRLRDAVPVASSTVTPGYDVLNLRDLRDFTWWEPTALPATITVDSGSARSLDYTAIYGHNLFSCGCTIETRKSTDNFAANDVLVDTHTPADNKPILRLYAGTTSRYTRLRITGASTPSIAIALVGAKLEVPVAGMQQHFDPLGNALQGQYNRSIEGRPIGRVINYREWRQTASFELVTWTWVRSTWQAAAQAWLEAQPWLFAWNPDTYPKETYHVAMQDTGWKAPHRSGSFCDLQVPLVGVIPT